MTYILLLISAYFMGCIAAIPAGPVQIEVVRRSINGQLKSSLLVVLGAFLIDVFYGLIAFFGIAPFLEEKKVMAIFWLAGGVILIVMSVFVIRHRAKKEISYDNAPQKRKRWALLGGISLSVINPMMILWWLSAVRIFEDIGLISEFNADIALTFLAAASLGLASYLTALSLFIHWVKKFVSAAKLRRINQVFAVFLLLIGLYFLYTSIHTLFLQG
ncbi:MAG: LysE family transporter [Candidatus Sulfobium sp.]